MRVVLARRREDRLAAGEPPSVHAYRIDDDDPSPAIWQAPCGNVIRPDDAELVEPFTGAPCPGCAVIAALASTASAPALPAAPDAELVDSSGRYAISWRERLVHRVGDEATCAELDGRSLVMGTCGFLGWGPVASAPEGWPLCGACEPDEASA